MGTKFSRYTPKDDQTILLSIENNHGDVKAGCRRAAVRLDRSYQSVRAHYNNYLFGQEPAGIGHLKPSPISSPNLGRALSQVIVEDGTMEIEDGKAVLTGKFTLLL